MLRVTVENTVMISIVHCAGRIMFGEPIEQLRDAVLCHVNKVVEIDFGGVEPIDAAGLGLLASLSRLTCTAGVELRLVHPTQSVRELLELVRFDKVINIVDVTGSASYQIIQAAQRRVNSDHAVWSVPAAATKCNAGLAMDRTRLQRFRAALEVRRVDLRRNIAHVEQYGRTMEDEAAADTVDGAESGHSKDLLVRRIASEHGLLRNIEAALLRIRDGSFGKCVLCGTEINSKRLEAVPWARYCTGCQESLERRL